MNIDKTIFKAYDIRGTYPDQISEDAAYAVGKALVTFLKCSSMVVGRDMRTSSEALFKSFISGVLESGCNVIDIGLVGTELIYFSVGKYGFDCGVMITASHNPPQYNGIKIVKRGVIPISGDSGIYDIRDIIINDAFFGVSGRKGSLRKKDVWEDFKNHVFSFIDIREIRPLKIVVDAGNGMAGKVVPAVFGELPIEIIPMYFNLDGRFPNHIPDPLKEDNVEDLKKRVLQEKADLGLAYDGDGDRCFFIDEHGVYNTGYFITALLARILLKKHPKEKIIYGPRLTWAIKDTVEKSGGVALENKVGHSFFKERMRKENALFGGEVSSHFYFRENFYADSGVIPALLIIEYLSESGKSLGKALADYRSKYFISGEINRKVKDRKEVLVRVENFYKDRYRIKHIDGVSVEAGSWRFNIRPSNTEPLIRLNVEAKDPETVKSVVREVSNFLY